MTHPSRWPLNLQIAVILAGPAGGIGILVAMPWVSLWVGVPLFLGFCVAYCAAWWVMLGE